MENREHEYYRFLSETEPVKSIWVNIIKKHEGESYRDPERKYYPLLVLLKKKGDEYVIDDALNKRIEQHSNLFTELYRYHNVGSRTETVNKFPSDLSEAVRNFSVDINSTN